MSGRFVGRKRVVFFGGDFDLLMLQMRRGAVRKNGGRAVVPLVRERRRKYGEIVSESALSTKRDVLITGANSSGKSRWLARYEENSAAIWPGRVVVVLRAVNPLMSWYDNDQMRAWAKSKSINWGALSAHGRAEMLPRWIADVGAVVLLDDGHKLTGRKADLFLAVARSARVLLVSASDLVRIPLTVRLAVQARNPQVVRLSSDAPYDTTAMVVWLMTIIALGSGAYMIAALLGGMNMLGKGARAAKNA